VACNPKNREQMLLQETPPKPTFCNEVNLHAAGEMRWSDVDCKLHGHP
jgi:hypothetical protein